MSTWQGMIARCHDPRHVGYHNYGGRGITVCSQWRDDPRPFIAWIEANLGPRPTKHTLDRIDNDRGYEPGNIQWASQSRQRVNSRRGVVFRGSEHPDAKLTDRLVREARSRWATGERQNVLAAEYGVSKPTMHKALTRKTWQHVA
jgi:hypothetical protein